MGASIEGMEQLSLGRLGNFLGFRLRRLQNQFSRDFQAETKGWNLRAGMFSSLELISANPGISQAMLSAEVGLDKSALVPMIDALEERGWVERTRSTTDRRRNHLSITKAGEIELDRMFHALSITEAAGLATLTEREREMVKDALDKVYHAYVRPARKP
ncbi:MarR family winged helix-turn-helix transcriptional regulator [soil metagenome]